MGRKRDWVLMLHHPAPSSRAAKAASRAQLLPRTPSHGSRSLWQHRSLHLPFRPREGKFSSVGFCSLNLFLDMPFIKFLSVTPFLESFFFIFMETVTDPLPQYEYSFPLPAVGCTLHGCDYGGLHHLFF